MIETAYIWRAASRCAAARPALIYPEKCSAGLICCSPVFKQKPSNDGDLRNSLFAPDWGVRNWDVAVIRRESLLEFFP